MACIHKRVFFELCNSFPDILIKMKRKALKYRDPWKEFKLTVLKQVDYFADQVQDDEFYDEVQFHLIEEHLEKGTELISQGEQFKSMFFIVQGQVELTTADDGGKEHHVTYLKQGDCLGQYSVLFDEPSCFSAKALTRVRILQLSQKFYMENKDIIEDLENCIEYAEDLIDLSGVPVCDFKIFKKCQTKK